MYTVELYRTLSRAELELRLNNLKHIARIWTQHKNVIDRVLANRLTWRNIDDLDTNIARARI